MKKWLTQFILAARRRAQKIAAESEIEAGPAHQLDGECPVYPDHHIERCAQLYLDNPQIRAHGVLFTTFLAYPEEIMRAVHFGLAMPLPEGETFYPLLPAQREVARRVQRSAGNVSPRATEREIDAHIAQLERLLTRKRLRVADSAVIEPMHHRTHPRHADKRAVRDYGAPIGEEAGVPVTGETA